MVICQSHMLSDDSAAMFNCVVTVSCGQWWLIISGHSCKDAFVDWTIQPLRAELHLTSLVPRLSPRTTTMLAVCRRRVGGEPGNKASKPVA